MKRLVIGAAIVGVFFLGTGAARAQDGNLKKKINAKIDPEKLKKLVEMIAGGVGKLDPEALSKMIDKISQGHVQVDPALFKMLQEKIARDKIGQFGKIDADGLFKKLDENGDGKLTKKEFLKIADEFKDKIGENRMVFARALLASRYDELDPNGNGLTLDQFRKEVARFQKEQGGK
jgi:Ca2+-binding EF-hand superfamily protein